MVEIRNKFKKVRRKDLLPLISVSAVLRDYQALEKLINAARIRKISFKKIYEVLLQNYLFAGYPSALLSLKVLRNIYPSKKLPKAADMNLYHFMNKGIINCRKIYGEKFEKLIKNLKGLSPDLAEWLVFEGYGKVLGRKGLTFKERELCIVAVLTVLKFKDQLYSHINGAIRVGASIEEIKSAIKNIDLVGNKNFVKFGLAILNKFEKEKGMTD